MSKNFQGKIEVIGSFSQLAESGVDYAQLLQLGDDDEEDNDDALTPAGGADVDSQRSLVRALRQLSRTSFRVRKFPCTIILKGCIL